MSLAAVILFSTVAASAVQATPVPRTAFACMVFDSDAKPRDRKVRKFTFLLAGRAAEVGQDATIETFDPSRILDGGRFVRFMKGADGPDSFVALTGDIKKAPTIMLTLRPSKENDFEAALGSDGKAKFFGRCKGLESADTAADFAKFNSGLRQ